MKECIHTQAAPAAVGPYSQAVRVQGEGTTAFISGQIPLNPETGQMVAGGIEGQTRQVMKNLQAVVEACGSDLAQVLKVNIYLTNMANFAAVNAIYAEYFSENPPARACVEVTALPKGAEVEMEAVTFCPRKDA